MQPVQSCLSRRGPSLGLSPHNPPTQLPQSDPGPPSPLPRPGRSTPRLRPSLISNSAILGMQPFPSFLSRRGPSLGLSPHNPPTQLPQGIPRRRARFSCPVSGSCCPDATAPSPPDAGWAAGWSVDGPACDSPGYTSPDPHSEESTGAKPRAPATSPSPTPLSHMNGSSSSAKSADQSPKTLRPTGSSDGPAHISPRPTKSPAPTKPSLPDSAETPRMTTTRHLQMSNTSLHNTTPRLPPSLISNPATLCTQPVQSFLSRRGLSLLLSPHNPPTQLPRGTPRR